MLFLLKQLNGVALVGYESTLKEQPEIVDWNVDYGTFTYLRTAFVGIPKEKTDVEIKALLNRRPEACIYNIVAHNPVLNKGDRISDLEYRAKTQQIVIEGKPYIDLFGLHVYITSRAAWERRSDVDLRFAANKYPYHHLDPEIERVLTSDYDILSRSSP